MRKKYSAWQVYKMSGWISDKYLIFCEAKKGAASAVDLAVRTYETKLSKLSKSDPKLF